MQVTSSYFWRIATIFLAPSFRSWEGRENKWWWENLVKLLLFRASDSVRCRKHPMGGYRSLLLCSSIMWALMVTVQVWGNTFSSSEYLFWDMILNQDQEKHENQNLPEQREWCSYLCSGVMKNYALLLTILIWFTRRQVFPSICSNANVQSCKARITDLRTLWIRRRGGVRDVSQISFLSLLFLTWKRRHFSRAVPPNRQMMN